MPVPHHQKTDLHLHIHTVLKDQFLHTEFSKYTRIQKSPFNRS
jgi:hypothetical protein